MFQKSLRTAIAVTFLSFLGVTAAWSQATDGNIVGSVVDSSGAAIAKANVETLNLATGIKSQTMTDGQGVYRAENLLVGTYKVSVTAAGFAPAAVENVAVTLNLNTTVNVTLTVGSVTSTVEVTVAAALIDTTTAQVTNSYTTQEIANLPVTVNPAGGNNGVGGVINLSLLGAGVTSNGGIGVGLGPSIGGQRPRNNSFNIEGVDNNRKDITGPVASVPSETVAEFTIIQNQFSAEYGHSSGGQFNSVLVSGTNTVHGAIWEYLQNRNLDAINQSFARQFVGQQLPPNPRFDENRLGAMIGGPIKKNKLFYFGSYEYNPTGQASVPASSSFAPTAAGYSILSGLPQVNQTLLGLMQKNVSPAPVASSTTTVAGFTIPTGVMPIVAPNFANIYRWIASVDYSLGNNDQFRARYIDNRNTGVDIAANLPVFFTTEPVTSHLGTFSEFHNFSPNIVNEFRAAYNRFNQSIVIPGFTFPGLDVFPNIGINNALNLDI